MFQVLEVAERNTRGFVSITSLVSTLEWKEARADAAVRDLLKEGLAWKDDQNGAGKIKLFFPSRAVFTFLSFFCTEILYWFPSLFPQLMNSSL